MTPHATNMVIILKQISSQVNSLTQTCQQLHSGEQVEQRQLVGWFGFEVSVLESLLLF
jgi:hypothetical protein